MTLGPGEKTILGADCDGIIHENGGAAKVPGKLGWTGWTTEKTADWVKKEWPGCALEDRNNYEKLTTEVTMPDLTNQSPKKKEDNQDASGPSAGTMSGDDNNNGNKNKKDFKPSGIGSGGVDIGTERKNLGPRTEKTQLTKDMLQSYDPVQNQEASQGHNTDVGADTGNEIGRQDKPTESVTDTQSTIGNDSTINNETNKTRP